MPQSKEILEEQLKKLSEFQRVRTAPELRFLPEVLDEREKVYCLTSGHWEGNTWAVVLTNRRLIFLDKGFFSGLSQIDIPINQVVTVSQKSGLFFGALTVTTSAGAGSVLTITQVPRSDIVILSNQLCALVRGDLGKGDLSNRSQDESVAQKMDGFTGDAFQQIEGLGKLQALREKGALSEEEFLELKAKILKSECNTEANRL